MSKVRQKEDITQAKKQNKKESPTVCNLQQNKPKDPPTKQKKSNPELSHQFIE